MARADAREKLRRVEISFDGGPGMAVASADGAVVVASLEAGGEAQLTARVSVVLPLAACASTLRHWQQQPAAASHVMLCSSAQCRRCRAVVLATARVTVGDLRLDSVGGDEHKICHDFDHTTLSWRGFRG